jgi:hypothetical protein
MHCWLFGDLEIMGSYKFPTTIVVVFSLPIILYYTTTFHLLVIKVRATHQAPHHHLLQ